MKKITLILAMSVFGSFLFAQHSNELIDASKLRTVNKFGNKSIQSSKKTIQPPNYVAATQSFWLNYGETKKVLFGGVSTDAYNYMCTDSVTAAFGTVYDAVWVNNIFDVLDVKSPDWQIKYPGMIWNKFSAYDIDSMAFRYVYERTNPSLTVTDTVVIKYYQEFSNVAATFPIYFFQGTNIKTNYGVDTLRYVQPKYNGPSNSPTAGVTITTVKIALGTADTTSTGVVLKYFKLPATVTVGAGKLFATSMTYKPGVAYTVADTMYGKKLNGFLFASLEEQGGTGSGGSYPIFPGCNKYLSNCDWNCSYVVRLNERYVFNGNSWNNFCIPTWAFTQPYSYEHHAIWYKATSTTVGVDEASKISGIQLGQNSPNPTSGKTEIDYQIENSSNVSLEIYDITGKKVMNLDQGYQVAGYHTIEINAGALNNGVYFYTLKAGENRLTKKMTVVD